MLYRVHIFLHSVNINIIKHDVEDSLPVERAAVGRDDSMPFPFPNFQNCIVVYSFLCVFWQHVDNDMIYQNDENIKNECELAQHEKVEQIFNLINVKLLDSNVP